MDFINLSVCSDGIWILNVKNSESTLNTYIETNSLRLRNKYLEFVADLSEFEFKGKNFANHFQFENGHNLWWMSLLVEKSSYKSPAIADCIKLLAFEEILIANKPDKVTLNTGDRKIIKSIKILCAGLDIELCHHRKIVKGFSFKKVFNLRSIYLYFPHPVRALFFFCKHLGSLAKPKRFQKSSWFRGLNSIFIFSYFIHIDQQKASLGIFYSRQWEILPKILNELGIKCNWLHHYLKCDVANNIDEGSRLIDKFNENSVENGMHAYINWYSSFWKSLKIIGTFFSVVINSPNNAVLTKAFRVRNSAISFWPFLMDDWKTSIIGTTAIQNLIWTYQMDQMLKEMPTQKLGLYLQENQGWEKALITSWKKNGHGTIIGVQHSSTRFWDLRLYDHQRVISGEKQWSQPQPHYTALNGPFSLKSYIEVGYNEKQFINLEALRYLRCYSRIDCSSHNFRESNGNIIILGDILMESNESLLKKMQKISQNWTALSIKSHPGAIINIADYPTLNLFEERDALSNVLPNYDISIVVGSTTAALDSYLAGLKVVVFLMEGELNMSPLRGFEGVRFVTNEIELEQALNSKCTESISRNTDYFWTDKNLPRWKSLLSHYYKIQFPENT